jgi:hypothetical protein
MPADRSMKIENVHHVYDTAHVVHHDGWLGDGGKEPP